MLMSIIDRGLLTANYHADLASKRRALSAWGTVECKGSGWSWRWTGIISRNSLTSTPTPGTVRFTRENTQMKAYGFRRNESLTKGRRLRSKNRRALRRIGAGYARSKAARDLREWAES